MSKKIYLVYIVNQLGLGGTEKAIELVAKRLPKARYDVSVIAMHSGGVREKNFADAGIRVIIARDNLSIVTDFLKENKVDIVHIHYLVLPLQIFAGKRLILHHHFSQALYTKDGYQKFEHVIFNSQRTRQKFYELTGWAFDSRRDVVVYSPVDTDRLLQTVEGIPEKYVRGKKNELGIKEGDFVIGRLGRPDIVKWSDTLIYALPILTRSLPNLKIILQSVPRSRTWILTHSPWRKFLILNPATDPKYEVALFYRLIDIYTHAAKIGESFGLTLAEAGASKKPVVVTSTPRADNAQIEVIDHETTGLVTNTPVDFAKAIIKLSGNQEKQTQMGIAGYHKVVRTYDSSVIATSLEELYSDTFDFKKNAHDFHYWQKEYQRRLHDQYAYTPSFSERLYLYFIKVLTYGTRVSDVLEHYLDV